MMNPLHHCSSIKPPQLSPLYSSHSKLPSPSAYLQPNISPLPFTATRLSLTCSRWTHQLTRLFPVAVLAPHFDISYSKDCLAKFGPLEAVLFDVDGTLCDSDLLHYNIFREMLQEIGYNDGAPISEDFFAQNIAGKHGPDVAMFLYPNDLARGIKFMDDKEALFRILASHELKPLNGLNKLKKWIEDRGLKRAAVTNAPRPNAQLMISAVGLSDFFDAVILGDECERGKPYPDPYLKALQLLKVSKLHTLIFEDSVSGIKAGVAAGIPVIGVATRTPEHLLLEAKPVFLIKDYNDPKLWAALEEIDLQK